MNWLDVTRRFSQIALVAALCAGLGFAAPARAALVSTRAVLEPGSVVEARERVQALLSRPEVGRRLEALGVSADEASLRIDTLSDAEVVELDRRLDALPAGEGFLGFALGVIVITFAVLLITDVLGITDVFTFINPVGGARSY